jgi:hypothetical protein
MPVSDWASGSRLERQVWHRLFRVMSPALNRLLLFLLLRLGCRVDHPLFSPHLLVISRKPSGGRA